MKQKDVDVLRVLIENSDKRLNMRQLSQETGMDYKSVYGIVKRLEREELVELERFGKAFECKLIKKVHPLIFEAEYLRRGDLLRSKEFKIMFKDLSAVRFPIVALIFGSYAKGMKNKNSDIDLMVLCEKGREREIHRVVSLWPLKIHLVVLTFAEFLEMAKSREFSVVSEALKGNVLLVGIENYYKMVENVG